jgi:hypothetical protein
MYGTDSTIAPRFRLSRQRRTASALVQSGQQIRQTRLHRPEILIVLDGHNVNFFTDTQCRSNDTRRGKKFTRLD